MILPQTIPSPVMVFLYVNHTGLLSWPDTVENKYLIEMLTDVDI